MSQQRTEHHKKTDAERNPDEPGQQENLLHIPVAAPDLLLQRRELDSLLNGSKTLPVNHRSALVLQPLPKTHEGDEGHDHDDDFHLRHPPFDPLYSCTADRVALRSQEFWLQPGGSFASIKGSWRTRTCKACCASAVALRPL